MIDTLTNSVEELYTQYHKDIVRFFADHLADREASWDLCHEVFVRLLITLASGTQLQHPQRWLMRVAKNLLIDTYRHQRAASEVNLSFDSHELTMLASDATTLKTLLERKDMLQVIVETFHGLPEKYQRLLFWREIERLPLQEIALRTGTAEPILSTELWRARKLLQKEYQRRHFKDFLLADEEIFEHAATQILGPTGQQLTAATAILTTAATGNAVLVVTSRVTFAMARDELLPGLLARVHAGTGVPWTAVLLNGILLALVALTGSVALAAAVGGFLYVLHFVFPLVALVILRRRGGPAPAFSTPIPRVVLPIAFGGCLLLLVTSGWIGISGGLAWLLVGLLAYGAVHISRRARLRSPHT